jgi:D-2-hydroxyglutarate dehydrogenase
LGIGLGKASTIQCRYFGSVAAKIQRDLSFSTLNSDDISYFKGILGEKNVIQDEDRLAFANTDWMRKYKGSSKLLLLPRSTEEVLLSCLGLPDHHFSCV